MRAAAAVAVALAVGAAAVALTRATEDERAARDDGAPAVRPCDVDRRLLERVARGYVPHRSGDVVTIERLPHGYGTRHSTPYPYTQEVPLLLYGPGYVRAGVAPRRPVTVADLAPTYAELLGFDAFPRRDGRVLRDALVPAAERPVPPAVIVTVVWDGGGDNVLRQWPGAWPRLRALARRAAWYRNATVGSSPSITPSVHATIGTGAFPSGHGIPDIKMRVGARIVDAWEGESPRNLRMRTLADLFDAAHGNEPLVGLVARDFWHAGMIGHGSFLPEGDRDVAVLDDLDAVEFHTNERFYELPPYLLGVDGLDALVDELDQRDGRADGRWLGNPLVFDGRIRQTPAWSVLQTRKIVQLLRTEGFGADDVPDLFFTNYKSVDLAGHYWDLYAPEVRDDLAEQDRQLALLVDTLDRVVGRGRYVLALTADHGLAPHPGSRDGWSIDAAEMKADVERALAPRSRRPLVVSHRGYQLYLDHGVMRAEGVSADDVAAFVRDYRLGDNVSDANRSRLPKFDDRRRERLYLTALTPEELFDALDCGAQARRARSASSAARATNSALPSR
ncbi:MAG TPA: alkaline phosphatase family protein [Actinomycetota bacterium]|nr:alkaline phosphatase family protein [Actinomycetota bacterium]